jgi:hypothetical protein
VPRACIRSRLLADGQAVVDVPPMVGRGVSRIDPAGFDGVDRPQNVVDLGKPSMRRRISPPGRTNGRVE